jgi:probable HAF family extracellular repeat protein
VTNYFVSRNLIQVAGSTSYNFPTGVTEEDALLWERTDSIYGSQTIPYYLEFSNNLNKQWNNSVVLGINNVYPTQEVGWAEPIANPLRVPALFEQSGNTILPTLGIGIGEARGINNNGHIVGWGQDANNQHRALVWTKQAGNYQPMDLGTLGGNESEAFAINNAGQIVGWAHTVNGDQHAFLWTPGGTDGISGNPQMKDIHDPSFKDSVSLAINNNGRAVGQLSGPSDQAFYWSAITGNKLLPNIGYSAIAKAINDNDIIVGSSKITSTSDSTAVSWENFLISNLNFWINHQSGWVLEEATAINNGGSITCNAHKSAAPASSFGVLLDPYFSKVSIPALHLVDPIFWYVWRYLGHFPEMPLNNDSDLRRDTKSDLISGDFTVFSRLIELSREIQDTKTKEKLQKLLMSIMKDMMKNKIKR